MIGSVFTNEQFVHVENLEPIQAYIITYKSLYYDGEVYYEIAETYPSGSIVGTFDEERKMFTAHLNELNDNDKTITITNFVVAPDEFSLGDKPQGNLIITGDIKAYAILDETREIEFSISHEELLNSEEIRLDLTEYQYTTIEVRLEGLINCSLGRSVDSEMDVEGYGSIFTQGYIVIRG